MQFKTLDNKNKLIWLMNSENKDVLLELCNFIKNNENTLSTDNTYELGHCFIVAASDIQ